MGLRLVTSLRGDESRVPGCIDVDPIAADFGHGQAVAWPWNGEPCPKCDCIDVRKWSSSAKGEASARGDSVLRISQLFTIDGYADKVIERQEVYVDKFNPAAALPYNLRVLDFQSAMQDVYDFLYDVNTHLRDRKLSRLDDMLRPAIFSGTLSDMLTDSLAKHARSLTHNRYFNGHPDLIVEGVYPNNSVKAGTEGVEIKTTKKRGGAVDTHGGRKQWMCVFVYEIDTDSEPASQRSPLRFREVYLGEVVPDDFRKNERGELGTRTATLDRDGIAKLRESWVYLDQD